MKKFWLLCFAILVCAWATAAIPGEVPGNPPHQLRWVNCSPMPLGKLDPQLHKDIPQWRVIVFMLTGARDTNATVSTLEKMRRMYQGKVLISIITPDNVSDAESLRRRFPDMRVRLAVDVTRKLTPEYMKDTIMLFPMAFIMDSNGMIRWRGEAVDLPEITGKLMADKLPLDVQKKITPMIYSMQQQMRDGDLYKAQTFARQILDADPGNPSALRLAVFAAENRNHPEEAWQIVYGELKKSPDSSRIYFTALDLIMRHEICRRHLAVLVSGFAAHPFPATLRCAFADTLLNSFPFEVEAVLGAKKILASTPMPIDALPGQMAHLLAVRGRLKYALGDLKGAEADLTEAIQYLQHSGSSAQLQQAKKQVHFYRTLIKEQEQERP